MLRSQVRELSSRMSTNKPISHENALSAGDSSVLRVMFTECIGDFMCVSKWKSISLVRCVT